ncbi:ssDNA endodeoxyribonuclease SAE2 SKDI_07G0890 [Saccharomyces kudriavzevii IFO 1802]|uniref:SAE2-like protein n=2 Tax=Saccharomyces kudriavzevii (strain ATCC MYA-4449 / AS 2.2408 / CBS 8840 / NBRC 1802 / NCYC 2889) TaxID=226230 RepID=J6EN76_SACK1|nr:uncharacterized protein SKDI_07G0890 [Saccharomyces kudriavzevii IFO 1802]EJT44397.1 SAE2-like protein [Saccharomyces kudriavzevii IFO 1802]CAI4061570.1 hypothetical protein SKDI_07G0890 [Saccharomyces kudriavzevii IFO 1802]
MVANGESFSSESSLPILKKLSLNELLNVQHDVTVLIAKRVRTLQSRSSCILEGPNSKLSESLGYQKNVPLQSSQLSVEAMEQDSQDFILTQFDEDIKKGFTDTKMHHHNEYEPDTQLSVVTISPNKHKRKISEFSSPLNGPDLEDCSDTIIHELGHDKENKTRRLLEVKIEKPEFTSPNLFKQEEDNSLVDFNTNPLTKRAWILEDFRPNENTAPVKRGRRKLERFYAQVGKPEDPKHKSLSTVMESQNSDFELAFDNLRNRSKSPPGFGRLDFPSTQEGNEDKKKSQEIIRKKTKHRFLMAINGKIPPYEREYVFKKEELNRIVDDGGVFWSEKLLQIYARV